MADDSNVARLDLCLRRDDDGYEVELRFWDPTNQAERAPVRGACPLQLAKLTDFDKAGEVVFADAGLRQAYETAKAIVDNNPNLCLSLRLVIEPSASELHALPWERFADPTTKARLAESERVIFSRFLWSDDWRRVQLKPKRDLRTLIAVAAPTNLAALKLAEIKTNDEIDRVLRYLGGLPQPVILGRDTPASFDAIADALREGVDIFYLLCHGELVSAQESIATEDFQSGFGDPLELAKVRGDVLPYLYLENHKTREVEMVSGGRLARRIADMPEQPRLALLVSCEGAGKGQSADAFRNSLAPRLARAGIPAIVAMQDKISIETANRMMPRLISHLVKEGQVDRAMAAARSAVRDRGDAWIPALFTRLRSRIWYEPGFGGSVDAKVKWEGLAAEINNGEATALVGWGVAEHIYGSKSDLAARLAREKRVPFTAEMAGSLALVSQYLLVKQSTPQHALNCLIDRMRAEVFQRHRNQLAPALAQGKLSALLSEVGRLCRQNPADPLLRVAQLPVRVFINTSPDNLLVEALRAENKKPTVLYAPWRRDAVKEISFDAEPTAETPVVFHIFGYLAEPKSMVITEDEHLDHLMGIGMNKALIPQVVREALVNRSLLFLGFQLTDWTFRILFRVVMNLLGGGALLESRPHVGVQVEPDGALFEDMEDARDYLRAYYQTGKIDVFWGSSDEFLAELQPHLASATHGF